MRRQEREITAFSEIIEVMGRCEAMHLAMLDGEKPYVVPLNFGYRAEGETLTMFFHCAKEGRKVDLLRQNSSVCFSMACTVELIQGPEPCSWSCQYESVIGEGTVRFLEDPAQKTDAFACIMNCNGYEGAPVFPEAAVARTELIAIDVTSVTGKRNLRK